LLHLDERRGRQFGDELLNRLQISSTLSSWTPDCELGVEAGIQAGLFADAPVTLTDAGVVMTFGPVGPVPSFPC
jgi:hypothetical protein